MRAWSIPMPPRPSTKDRLLIVTGCEVFSGQVKVKRVLIEMLGIVILALLIALIYNAVSPAGVKLIRQKQKQAEAMFPDARICQIRHNLAGSETAA